MTTFKTLDKTINVGYYQRFMNMERGGGGRGEKIEAEDRREERKGRREGRDEWWKEKAGSREKGKGRARSGGVSGRVSPIMRSSPNPVSSISLWPW